jgi:hypothetical protein
MRWRRRSWRLWGEGRLGPVRKRDLTREGECKLTGEHGRFVRSHIIPRALAPPAPNGKPFAQIGQRRRPTRRRDSWYDQNLVTRPGENILTAFDTFAIAELRRLKLVWQSWGPMQTLCVPDFTAWSPTHGGRQVIFSDPSRMRLFFLSLLWRAAATTLAEFSEIDVRASDMRRLRAAIRDGIDPGESFYPVTLTQLSTLGLMHNHGPIAQIKPIPQMRGVPPRRLQIFRFFMDGLIAHFHRDVDAMDMDGLTPMLVGGSSTVISTVSFEASFQAENLAYVMAEAEYEFPGIRARAEGR